MKSIVEARAGSCCRSLSWSKLYSIESKAQMHFRQLAFLSGMLNRTVVLPNVGGSRLGACLEHDFDFYYSSQWAVDHADDFSTISMENFSSWVKERLAVGFPATSQTFHVHLDLDHKQLQEPSNCFADWMDTSRPDRRIYLHDTGNARRRKGYQDVLYNFFSQTMEDPEVLSTYYDRRYPFIHNPAAQAPIPYNERITDLVKDMAQELSPYWAVHWRTERVEPPENLVGCAESLIDLVHTNQEQQQQKEQQQKQPRLVMLTDYPHVFSEEAIQQALDNNPNEEEEEGMKPASASFPEHALTKYHHLAFQHVYSNIQVQVTNLDQGADNVTPPANWTVLPISPQVAGHDSGVLGIIDKLLAIHADVFIAGEPGICARRSSFTARIIDERILRRGDDTSITDELPNVVEYFGLPRQ
ncbi:hypothetical protein RO3G_11163 [Lichtheimia corymbifera JMRC:FSU:9682]|uniref:Proteophosphoglycan 5 n=1 Tax=Lichtheimia corymbifera JMRC:FSU:9682 TaxID=1263082 RepID=A0A068RYV7_9FUNG|nr:hypothetical protein RO3G_11163 [Lichtheimia corymbifera JMRC:FSU:9682]